MKARAAPVRLILYGLIALFALLQYPLWVGNGSLLAVWRFKREIEVQRDENARLRERNQALAAEVVDLKQGLAAVEERARVELGMIKKGETFFQVIDAVPAPNARSGPKPVPANPALAH